MPSTAAHLRGGSAPKALTPFGAIARLARDAAAEGSLVQWPSPRWRDDPVAFAREVLGIELAPAQVQLVESIRDHRNTTCRSGHKCGKSTAVAVAGLWFFASFDGARVLLTAVKAAQVEDVLWTEIRRLYRLSKRGRFPLDGVLEDLARTGLRHEDGRRIWGLTARDPEGLAGLSGPNLLILVDEASGVKDEFFEVLGSSLAGSGGTVRKCYISNPTRTSGEFYLSHTVNAGLFNCLHFSSEDTPNARGERVIPGLAGPEWIEERRLEYGEDSPRYKIRVRGEFVHGSDGKIISLEAIAVAQAAYDETPEEGDLQLGIDPAGDGIIGDESAIAARLGRKVLTVLAWRSLTEDALVTHALDLVAHYRKKATRGAPRIAIDVEGGIGTRVLAKLRAAIEVNHLDIEVIPVRSGKVLWGSKEYHQIRDALWGEAQKFLRVGPGGVCGALPEDAKLEAELNAPAFTADANSRLVSTPKKELRKILGRSPDRADAVCLAVWRFESVGADEAETATLPPARPAREGGGDAYDGGDAGIDPYEIDGIGGGGDGVYS